MVEAIAVLATLTVIAMTVAAFFIREALRLTDEASALRRELLKLQNRPPCIDMPFCGPARTPLKRWNPKTGLNVEGLYLMFHGIPNVRVTADRNANRVRLTCKRADGTVRRYVARPNRDRVTFERLCDNPERFQSVAVDDAREWLAKDQQQ